MMCECAFCQRSREVHEKLELIPKDLREYFSQVYELLCYIEEDRACTNIYLDNLKIRYPMIHKEVVTIKPADVEDNRYTVIKVEK
jgi:hypothetical protein